MNEGFLYELSKLLECPVCMETFENPKQLWCGHALCLKCFTKMKQPYIGLRCPLCRVPTKVSYRHHPPLSFIVQDFVQLYNKEMETRKFLNSIMPLLNNNSQSELSVSMADGDLANGENIPPKQPNAELVATGNSNNSGPFQASLPPVKCTECQACHEINNLWLCIDCAKNAICSRCILLKQHSVHSVKLCIEILYDRKLAVQKWRESVSASLDKIYKNRVDLEYDSTRLKILRLQKVSSQRMFGVEIGENAGDSRVSLSDNLENEYSNLQNSLLETKKEFDDFRSRLSTALQQNNEAFLFSSEEVFRSELAWLKCAMDNLFKKQSVLFERQQSFIDSFTRVHSG